ncbi:MAG: Fe-S cluster assembly protein SufD [Pyrinomonadaceae bacterium]
MTLPTAVMKTSFTEDFNRFIESESDAVLRRLREEAFAHFAANGFPTPKHEDWKYTNVSSALGAGWKVDSSLSSISTDDLAPVNDFCYTRNGFTALNLAFGEFRVIRIAKDTVVEKPLEFRFAATDGSAIFPHVVVIAETGSKATLLETYSSGAKSFTNTAVQIIVEDNANLTHYRVQRDSPDAFNYGVTEVSLGRGSRYDSTNINLGGAMSRHDMWLKFTATGGEAFVDGLYMLGGLQHHDTHSIIDHTVPDCVSHQTYKGVLNDKSRGVFNGKVFVRENASGTDAKQSNKNLLLSNDARVDTKPQLEIFNDDVKCAHGATVGQLEEEELFYLLTRGLPEALARNLLTYGFAEEIINKIGIDVIKKELDSAVLNRLNTKLEG